MTVRSLPLRLDVLRAGVAALVVGFAALSAIAGAFADPARAGEPVDVEGAYVTDTTGTLSPAELDRVDESLDALFARTGEALYVVVTDTFEDPRDPAAWAAETASLSGLGLHDLLLAIAIDDRNYAYSVDDGFALSNEQIDDVIADALVPSLRDDRWADGIVSFSTAMGDTLDPPFPVVPVAIGGAVVLGLGAWIALRVSRPARERARARRRAARERAERRSKAGAMLVATDDAVKTSTQELGFAVAQFGDEATAEFAATLDTARTQLAEAFGLRARLEDEEPDADTDADAWLDRIRTLCEQTDAALDAQSEAFDALRDLERHAPGLIEQITAQRAALPGRIGAAEASLTSLSATYGPAAVSGAGDSLARARALLAFVDDELAQARERLGAGRTGEAAVDVRAAQQAAGQIDQLVGTVEQLAVSLPKIASDRDAAVADLRADIAEARAYPDAPSGLADAAAAAQAALDAAADATPADSLTTVERANATLAQAFSSVRDQRARRERAAAQLPRALENAQRIISAASGYITPRRALVGDLARTRLAEAERELAAATAASDPEVALAHARTAADAGGRADRIARDEVNGPRDESGVQAAEDGGVWGRLFGGSDDSGYGGSGYGSGTSRSGWSSSSRSSFSRRSSGSSSRRSSGSSSSRRSSGSRSSSRRSGGGRF
ncbi:TPM domain-containing protein [Microbacterium sp. NEAU-LLC]|uniref:TPM domain-containing protein n=1 Tax=Microbacterium helvum TaxID=2773713 RepID=A0ABR8NMM1_9MICO|nr:TPM domain-containing protein [Microbacterium helvum]MBD3941910.1 TPM domain-containing protein [Microbacterium helvum]